MANPHLTEPRYGDPRFHRRLPLRDESAGGMWSWLAGITVMALIAFFLVISLGGKTAGNNPPPVTTGQSSPLAQPLNPSPANHGAQ
jgi:hypothetical protein